MLYCAERNLTSFFFVLPSIVILGLISACGDEARIDPKTFKLQEVKYNTKQVVEECKAEFVVDKQLLAETCINKAQLLHSESQKVACQAENERLAQVFTVYIDKEVADLFKDREDCFFRSIAVMEKGRAYEYCDARFGTSMDDLRKSSCKYDQLILINSLFEWRVHPA